MAWLSLGTRRPIRSPSRVWRQLAVGIRAGGLLFPTGDCMPHLVSPPVVKGDGFPKFLRSEDPALVEQWIAAENRPGRGIYRIMNPLVEGARVHSKENLAGILYIYVDIDTKDIEETAEDVERCLQELPLKPTWITRSGHGWHVVWELKECVDRGDDYYELAIEFQAQLINWLAADRLVRPWTILRLPGTTNYKREPYVPCEVMMTGDPVDITEIEVVVRPGSRHDAIHAQAGAGAGQRARPVF